MLKRIIIVLIFAIILLISATSLWYFNRPQPSPIERQALFEGVLYSRAVSQNPPLLYHVIEVDLSVAGLEFFSTPADPIEGFDYTARTTSDFLEDYDLQIAINGDFFDPWYSYTPFNYYPHRGDGVNARGLAMADGDITSAGYAPDFSSTLYITADNQASFTRPNTDIQTAISGNTMIVENGEYAITNQNDYLSNRHPRTAIALDENNQTLLLFVVDGRQPNYSIGATIPELADVIIEHGGYSALNLDGGGSVAMVMADENGDAHLLNSAIHTRIPYRERPIANHFGIFAPPVRTNTP
ncbi:MAG: hypothetical protein Phog2KO_34710 [Phototrophicaceae bacterium]